MYDQDLVKDALEFLKQEQNYFLPFALRIEICASFGPSFLAANKRIRREAVAEGVFEPATGDLARSWLALLAAEKVIPIWYEAVKKADKLHENLFGANRFDYADLIGFDGALSFAEYLLLISEHILVYNKYRDAEYMTQVLYQVLVISI